jgi:outer membrane lipoprotein-sorting protein
MLAPLLLLLAVPSAEPNEAEKLFRQMEAKVAKATTVECTYKVESNKVEFAMRTVQVRLEGKITLLLGEGNRVRMEMSDESGGMKGKSMVIADGTKMKAVGEGDPVQPREDVPKWLGEAMRAAVARSGVVSTLVLTSRGPADLADLKKEFKIDEHFRVGGFRLGKKEMVDKQEAQVVEYTLTLKMPKNEGMFGEGTFGVSVWIDTKTQLPLKRVLLRGNGWKFTETYTKLEVDGKIAPKQFELPKD